VSSPIRGVLAVVGATATGKSALALTLAERFNGEIVSCDSTAVYRRIDIGTDKVPPAEQRGIPHHLVDLVEPTDIYSGARYARDAAAVVRDVLARGRVPIVAGGTGFYYRALVRGLFEGPARDDRLRARLDRIASRRGVLALHRWLAQVDAAAAARIQPRDQRRLVRALEVYRLTGRPLTSHFAATRSPIADLPVLGIAVRLEKQPLMARVTHRVRVQFDRGVVHEVQSLLDDGVPPSAQAFTGLVYRQILQMLAGVRDEAATRALIVRENMQYARRQVTWFRGEPGLRWVDGPGESDEAVREATRLIEAWQSGRAGERPA
jgi:tRNA dimethylallyltransferase